MRKFLLITAIALALTSYGVYQLIKSEQPSSKVTYSDRLREIAEQVNSMNTTWKATSYAKWEGKSAEEIKVFLGSKLKTPEKKQDLLSSKVTHQDKLFDTPLPTHFDSRQKWPDCESIREIRDQSKCGSCWAVSSAGAMSDRVCIASGQKDQRKISAADILSCCTECGDGCDGGEEDIAFKVWAERGWVTGDAYKDDQWCRPYDFAPCAHHIPDSPLPSCNDGALYPTPSCRQSCVTDSHRTYEKDLIKAKSWYTLRGEEDIAREVFENGPVAVGFTVYEDFMTYSSGIYHHVTGESMDGHAVRIIGFGEENGEKFWLIANSWNNSWGENGTFRFRKGTNECDMESDAVGGIADV